MKNFIKENWFKLGILIVITVIGLSYLSKNNNDNEILAMKAKCTKDAESFVSQGFQETPPDTMILSKTFNYSSELKTCLVDIETKTPLGFTYAIFDIYTTKPIASYTLNNPELGFKDSPEDMKSYSDAKEKYFPK